jgi:CheY-like chemotaxis protein
MTDGQLILFIENEQYPAHIRALKRAGFQVEEANCAWKAYIMLKTVAYAGVILDLMMPVKDKEILEELRDANFIEEIIHKSFVPIGLPTWVPGVRLLELIIAREFDRVGNGPDLPVVVVSGAPTPDVQARVKHLLGDLAEERYLIKPVSSGKMVAALEKALGIK